MSLFNYNTKIDPIGSLQARIAKIEKLLKALKFWEVNDTAMGDKTLRRRKVTPSLTIGAVGRGPWFDVTGLSRIAIGTGGTGDTTSYADYEFGFTKPTTAVVTVNAGELQDSLLAVKTAATANITVADVGKTYIFVQYVYGGAISILGSTARPVMDATTYRRILHQWTVVDGVATLSKISHVGNILIPGTFASEA